MSEHQTMAEMQQQLDEKGYVVVRNLLTDDEVRHYVQKLEIRSGITRGAMRGKAHGMGKRGLSQSWSLTDGVTKSADFWPLITHPKLVETVRGLLGDDVKYLQHSDLHVGFSAISWHRDSVNRTFGVGPEWDETADPYRIVRVGVYLQSYEESHFALGFIPGTHRRAEHVSWRHKLSEANLKWMGALSYLFTDLQMWAADAEWIRTEPGDCIIFDPRTQHSGSSIIGPKYSMFVAYGMENSHFYNHQNYYRNVRMELNYQPMSEALISLLQEHDLYQSQTPLYNEIAGAWTPSSLMKNIVARKVKA